MIKQKIKYYYDSKTLSYRRIESERKNIKWLISGLVLISVFAILFNILVNHFSNQKSAIKDNSITERIQNLNNISIELERLKVFISNQKEMLENQNNILNDLRLENKKLETVVDLKKEHVEALFKIHEERSEKRVWIERFYGILIGLFSSFFIALVFRLKDKYSKGSKPKEGDEIFEKKIFKEDAKK